MDESTTDVKSKSTAPKEQQKDDKNEKHTSKSLLPPDLAADRPAICITTTVIQDDS